MNNVKFTVKTKAADAVAGQTIFSDKRRPCRFVRLRKIASKVMHDKFLASDEHKIPVGCGGRSGQIQSGIDSLDEMLGSFLPGKVYLIFGKPATGKTTMLIDIAIHNVGATNQPVYILSMEESAEQIVEMMISHIVTIDRRTVLSGMLSEEQRVTMALCWSIMDAMPIYICDASGKNIDDLGDYVEDTIKDSVLLVDQLQLIPGKYKDSIHTLKLIAEERKIPVIVTSQLPYPGENDMQTLLSEINSFTNEPDIDSILVLQQNEISWLWTKPNSYFELLTVPKNRKFL